VDSSFHAGELSVKSNATATGEQLKLELQDHRVAQLLLCREFPSSLIFPHWLFASKGNDC
jgi:hypothetical protein